MTFMNARAGARTAWTAALIVSSSLLLAPASPALAEPGRTDPRPIRAVVLVDESGSLTPEGVAAEKEAAAVLTQSEFSPKSQVAVVGFGSTTGKPNQSAIDEVCGMTTVADGPSRDMLSGCVDKLHARTPKEGNDTDFAKALGQALNMLGPGSGSADEPLKIVFLLTDGKLDVSKSPDYGREPSQREAAALTLIDQYLGTARQTGVQIWPLGFGPAPDGAQLDRFAAGGSQVTCGPQAPPPRKRLVGSPADVVASLMDVFATARCTTPPETKTTVLGPGRTVELKVKVPAITTDGSIAVIKRDKRIAVQYIDPNGKVTPKSGPMGESTFQVSGENSPVEVLRIGNPVPGDWTVRLTSGPEVPQQDVSATVVWQGVVNSIISVDPPQPRVGELVTVRVHIRSRNEALTDRDALKGLVVRARLTGDGFDPVEVPLADDGRAPDTAATDGEYTGQIAIPTTAKGPLRFVGSVGGPGLDVDERPLDTRLADPNQPVKAQLLLERKTVAPGDGLTGDLTVTNSGAARPKLRLILDEFDDGTLATVTPSTIEAPASGSDKAAFTVRFDARTRVGPAQARLRVVDDADPTLVYADALYTFDVQYPPPWWERLWWLWPVLALVLAAAVVILLRRRSARRAEQDVRGITIQLLRDGRQIGKGVWARGDEWAGEFGFKFRDEDSPAPMLVNAPAEPGNYVVRRHPQGGVAVQPPHGPGLVLEPGRPKALQNGWDLGYHDTRAQGGPPDKAPFQPVVPPESFDPFADTRAPAALRDDLFN